MFPPFRVVIPARYGSTRLPGKPLLEIAGRPMIAWVAERARASGAAEVWVATDDARVADAVRQAGCDALLTRADHASGTDRVAEVAAARGWADSDIVVNVQGDEPLIEPELVRGVAAQLAAHGDAAMATACHPITDLATLFNPNAVKVVLDRAGYALYFSRAPVPYARDAFAAATPTLPDGMPARRHIGIYAYRAGFLREYGRLAPAPLEAVEALEQLRVLWHGRRIAVLETAQAPAAGVDTPEDLARVRQLMAGA